MVSGVTDVQSYKSNKGYYSAPSSQAPSTISAKRFSDGALRPWPPMYRSPASRAQMATYQAMSVSSAKLNFTNNFNGNHYNNGSSIYGRTKFNFHQFNMAASAAAAASSTNMKNAKNYYLVSQPYVKNQLMMPGDAGSFYGRTTDFKNGANGTHATNNNNVLMMADKEKNRFRKLRNPSTTTPPIRSSCACVRSKSMEDVRTEIVTDWATYNKENYNEFKKNRLNNGGAMGLMKHAGTRRSMDNLLEADANFVKQRFQVGIDLNFNVGCYRFSRWRQRYANVDGEPALR